eukprot:8537852-Heterocapsa_arctica.AAC.1
MVKMKVMIMKAARGKVQPYAHDSDAIPGDIGPVAEIQRADPRASYVKCVAGSERCTSRRRRSGRRTM